MKATAMKKVMKAKRVGNLAHSLGLHESHRYEESHEGQASEQDCPWQVCQSHCPPRNQGENTKRPDRGHAHAQQARKDRLKEVPCSRPEVFQPDQVLERVRRGCSQGVGSHRLRGHQRQDRYWQGALRQGEGFICSEEVAASETNSERLFKSQTGVPLR